MFTKNRPNKRIGDTKRTSGNERRAPRKNKFKKNSRFKYTSRKIRLDPFLRILAGLITLILVSLGMIFVHDLFTQTQNFNIEAIELKGEKHLTIKDVVNQCGVKNGDNLLGINLHLIRKRLLAHPWIENAEISRNMPNSLQIHISEFQPEATLEIENKRYLMSNKGIIFKVMTASDPDDLPLITGLTYTDLPMADLAASTQFKTVRKLLLMGRGDRSLIPNHRIRQISVDSDLGLTIEAFEPAISIRIGYDHYPQKYRNLKRILQYLKHQDEKVHASAIDLSDLEQIVVTPVFMESPHQGKIKEESRAST